MPAKSSRLYSLRALDADVTIDLAQDEGALESECRRHFRAGVDVVLDYFWGPSASLLLTVATRAAATAIPLRCVQIGSISAPTISLPSSVLRSTAIELMGSGIGSVPMPRIFATITQLLDASVAQRFRMATHAVPPSAVAS